MEIKEFIEETANVEKYYDEELDKFQRDIWYRELKQLNVARYRQVVREIFRQCKFMPKLADVVKINKNLSYANTAKQEEVAEHCDKCKRKGFILYKKKIDNGTNKLIYEYAARCDCRNGLKYTYDGTKIADAQHRSKYFVATVQQLGL